MEPGLRDRGHLRAAVREWRDHRWPQWSPVFATGVTRALAVIAAHAPAIAAMEPGLRDRGHRALVAEAYAWD